MRWLLPKSLNGFLLLGLAVLAGPLLFAILNATVQMRRLADSSQRLVADSVQTTRLSQDMYAQITLLERSARLYQVLGDEQVLAAFREHDQRISEHRRRRCIAQLRAAERARAAAAARASSRIRSARWCCSARPVRASPDVSRASSTRRSCSSAIWPPASPESDQPADRLRRRGPAARRPTGRGASCSSNPRCCCRWC